MTEIIIYLITILIVNFILKKINFIPNYSGHSHQAFTNTKNIPLTGGIFILFIFYFLFFENINLLIFFSIIFFIGFAGDKNYLVSPTKRLFLQIASVAMFLYFFDLSITNSRIDFFNLLLENDNFLKNNFINFLFLSFCIIVLINGSNFIDGLNGLLLGYFIIVLYIVFKINLFDQFELSQNEILFLFFSLTLLLILNYIGFFFLGDSGSYLIGFILSFILISLYNLNETIVTPYFIILLLWYPCFENLFSIIRKNKKGISPINPDNKHLHQLLFVFFKEKLNIRKNYLNPLVSILINLFNFIIIFSASSHPNNTKYQILYLAISILSYLTIYILLNKKLKLILNKK